MRLALRLLLTIVAVLFLIQIGPAARTAAAGDMPADRSLQSTTLTMVSPAACPASGCAAGQRMNLRFDFELANYAPSSSVNVKICVYAPTSWQVKADAPTTILGELTRKEYNLVDNCAEDTAQPTDYTLIAAREAAIDQITFSDTIGVALSLSTSASGYGRFVARLFELNAGGTTLTRSAQATTDTLDVATATTSSFVANDAAACGTNSPCYLNSGDDLANGIGTGLKDAIEASSSGSVISILGNYTIKSNTIVVNKALTLQGVADSTITFTTSSTCDSPMLSLQSAITVRDLNINDGSCTSPGRTLIEINSDQPVTLESNDLLNGDNAVFIRDNTGGVVMRYNHITGNTGYAVYMEGNANGASFEAIANNMHGNRSATAIDCSATATGAVANRKANHNYWGASAPTQEASHCTITSGKRLGAPIVQKSGAAGLNVQMVSVNETKTYAFDNQVAYRREGGEDFNLYIVDHGFMQNNGAPFTYAAGGDTPNPCSNAWDVFLPDGVSPTGALELSLKYDKSPACLAVINSNQYCDQTSSMSKYPLYWYDPNTNSTLWWDNTGERPGNLTSGSGQTTSCDVSANEVRVSIDSDGRPNLTSDLNYTPFMVGIPVLRTFVPLASNQAINVTWTTNNEPDISGFFVLRSLDGVNFSPISDLIENRGTALTGVTSPAYSFADSGRVNGVKYYYRLQIVRTDGLSFYSVVYSVSANIATITPTFTKSPTLTRTLPRPTNTPLPTRIPTKRPTLIPSRTFTPRVLPKTPTPFVLKTATPLGTKPTEETQSEFDDTPEISETVDETTVRETAQTTPSITKEGTPVPTQSATPQPTASMTLFFVETPASSTISGSWISLLLGLLAGLALVGGMGGVWYFRLKK